MDRSEKRQGPHVQRLLSLSFMFITVSVCRHLDALVLHWWLPALHQLTVTCRRTHTSKCYASIPLRAPQWGPMLCLCASSPLSNPWLLFSGCYNTGGPSLWTKIWNNTTNEMSWFGNAVMLTMERRRDLLVCLACQNKCSFPKPVRLRV